MLFHAFFRYQAHALNLLDICYIVNVCVKKQTKTRAALYYSLKVRKILTIIHKFLTHIISILKQIVSLGAPSI